MSGQDPDPARDAGGADASGSLFPEQVPPAAETVPAEVPAPDDDDTPEQLKVHLPAFDGPLDLLLHLIKKNKVNIWDIPIALITDQYQQTLQVMRELDLEIAGEFIYMAAVLIHIKSRMLLPRPEGATE